MKKLMIAAASAAMIGGVFADGQVYEMTLNVKTTEAKSGTVNVNDGCYTSQSYRKQTSVKIAGLFWGCDCSTIAETDELGQDKGVFFWNATKKSAFYDQDTASYIQPTFEWKLLNRIGQKAADCEGVWELTYGDAYLYGAGFGKVTGYESSAYVKSMSGNFAGTMNPGNQCKRCEEQAADAWPLCECGEQDDDLTAAYGSWTIKFNASSAKKFANTEGGDWSWYKFPGDVLTAIKAIIEEPETTDCAEATATLTELQEKLETLEDTYATIIKENAAYQEIIDQCESTNSYLEAAVRIAKSVYAWQTNTNAYAEWEVGYVNGSGKDIVDYGTNLTTFTELITKIDTRMLTFNYAAYDGNELTSLDGAMTFAATEVATTAELADDLTTAQDALDANTRKQQTAQQGIADNAEKLTKLDYSNTKAQLNAQIGAQKVVVNQVCD